MGKSQILFILPCILQKGIVKAVLSPVNSHIQLFVLIFQRYNTVRAEIHIIFGTLLCRYARTEKQQNAAYNSAYKKKTSDKIFNFFHNHSFHVIKSSQYKADFISVPFVGPANCTNITIP